jgi:glycerophosphoryl diester phosphodiesterase
MVTSTTKGDRMTHRIAGLFLTLAMLAASSVRADGGDDRHGDRDGRDASPVQVGPRPYYLVDQLSEGPLKSRLQSCAAKPVRRTDFSIGHRGAAMQFPEHTKESYEAAARMGAGIVECDVTFTKDRELVCRHAQNDLHTTTNILATPLASTCIKPFVPATFAADGTLLTPATAECRTSEITLAEFRTLTGKMDGANPRATTVAQYLKGTPDWRTEAYAPGGTLMTHRESIELFKKLGVGMTPELKSPSVVMPFEGNYTQQDYAQQMIDDYKRAGVSPRRVWPQSFDINDVYYWIANEPRFGRQAVALSTVNVAADVPAAIAALPAMRAKGVQIVAPPTWALVTLDARGQIVPSDYAKAARQQGFDIISWTLERSGPLTDGGGYYFQSIASTIKGPGDYYRLLDVLAREVGIIGLFSDWPATVSYYASCMGKR